MPMSVGQQNPTPKPTKGAASLIFFYYGDSKYTTMGQESLKLKKAMDGYKHKVLLKHESLPSWADISEKDEKLANIKDIPTTANLFKHLIQLAKDGYYIDLYIFSHGLTGEFRTSKGTSGSVDCVTVEDIKRELDPSKTGFAKMPIRAIWGTNCYGASMGEAWRSVGAKATAGARYVNFYPNSYGNFIEDWNTGTTPFSKAVSDSGTAGVHTLTQTYILGDAITKRKQWGGCSFGKTVLGDDDCARDYFDTMWLGKGEWQAGKSGKENMNHSSAMLIGGDGSITKNKTPVW